MARKSKHDEISDGDLRRLLNRYNCPMPFHAVRTFFLGNVACPTIVTRQQLSIIGAREINAVVLSCTRARRAALETMRATPPVWR